MSADDPTLNPAPTDPLDPDALVSEEEGPPELAEEQQLGGTPAGKAANAALRSLSRAARAFTLYDPGNEAIRRFLEDYRDRTLQALKVTGGLIFEVKTFELVLHGETVYLERDRERSLAFRLFRDGVRELSIQPGVRWEELLSLLEVLSVRFAGVRQQEDDVVTLLEKAGFQYIGFVAVEGFVAHDDEEDPAGTAEFAVGARPGSLQRAEALPDFDLPLPPPAAPKAFGPRPVPAAYLDALRAEESTETVPASALRLVREVVAAAANPENRIGLADAARVATEVRDFLVADRRLGALVDLVAAARALPPPAAAAFAPLVAGMGTPEALGKLLDAVGGAAETPPPELLKLLALVPGSHVRPLAVRFGQAAPEGPRRTLLRGLLAALARTDAEGLIEAIKLAEGAEAAELFAVLLEALPERAQAAALGLAAHSDPGVQAAALEVLGRDRSSSEEISQVLARGLESKALAVRIAAARAAGARHDLRAFVLLSKDVQKRAAGLSVEEAAEIGEALARIQAQDAQALMVPWVNTKAGLLKRIAETPATRMLKFVAVAGLGFCPGPEPEKLIRELAAQTDDEELKKHCVATMIRRRKEGGAPRG